MQEALLRRERSPPSAFLLPTFAHGGMSILAFRVSAGDIPYTVFVQRWRLLFVSAWRPKNRCHLNGLTMVDGQPKYVTAAETDAFAMLFSFSVTLGGRVSQPVSINDIIQLETNAGSTTFTFAAMLDARVSAAVSADAATAHGPNPDIGGVTSVNGGAPGDNDQVAVTAHSRFRCPKAAAVSKCCFKTRCAGHQTNRTLCRKSVPNQLCRVLGFHLISYTVFPTVCSDCNLC